MAYLASRVLTVNASAHTGRGLAVHTSQVEAPKPQPSGFLYAQYMVTGAELLRSARPRQALLPWRTSPASRHAQSLDDHGRPHIVDVGDKAVTQRQATAQAVVSLPPACVELGGISKKGSVIEVARLAGLMAAKKTADIIPLTPCP